MKLNLILTEVEKRYICENSIERILNTAARMALAVDTRKLSARAVEDAGVSLDDLDNCTQVTTKIWNAIRDAIFREVGAD